MLQIVIKSAFCTGVKGNCGLWLAHLHSGKVINDNENFG